MYTNSWVDINELWTYFILAWNFGPNYILQAKVNLWNFTSAIFYNSVSLTGQANPNFLLLTNGLSMILSFISSFYNISYVHAHIRLSVHDFSFNNNWNAAKIEYEYVFESISDIYSIAYNKVLLNIQSAKSSWSLRKLLKVLIIPANSLCPCSCSSSHVPVK